MTAIEAHRRYVAGVKEAVRMLKGKVPDPSTVSPITLGANPLEFAMPPMMEEAFGYRGGLRYVEFSYSPKTLEFGYSDGGDHLPSDANLWAWFLHHPLVSSEIDEGRYPTLYGKFTAHNYPTLKQFIARVTRSHKQAHSEACHCLLLDREQRQPYLCTREQLVIFLALVEPEDEDHHTVFFNGLLLSPGSENYKAPVSPNLVEQLHVWMDDQLEFVEGRANWPVGGSRHSLN